MEVNNAETAWAFVKAWRSESATRRERFLRIAADGARIAANLTPAHCKETRQGYLEAETILRTAG